MLSAGDDYPLHQRPEPIAFAGTDRNFYDRYFFNGQSPDGALFFTAALGVYPHLNVMDAAFAVMDDRGQASVLASRVLRHERMDTRVGPISVDVVEPLRRLKVRLADTEGLEADLEMEGLHFPIEEPRFTRRVHGRTLMDLTRMTQNVRWRGFLRRDGERRAVDGFLGTRDRSWGVRPVGAADPQPPAPPTVPQFFWLWCPLHFPGVSLFAHTNDDAAGIPWNRSAVLVDHATGQVRHLVEPRFALDLEPGTRQVAHARLEARMPDEGDLEAELTPLRHFRMHGLGYGHPTRGHGTFHGDLSVVTERHAPHALDPARPVNAHVQTLVAARLRRADGTSCDGQGVLEQLIIGPYAPLGLKELFDLA
ncbi:MAG: hypothetical protein NZM40_00840 [Sphingomonadaceae bacterium]|uniref:hypothetical protein n=1 Tax=Thermaurantiacus sp. TaxID=2820283 RepID=UPI00298F3164|nr:hypothetical protein [Thermaurantiacus sp.]MCS6985988.1 hypothetical protein [Sphingomonadaceae bacterium]MDW8414796.1 hypothetical protein [Thermaurantiacus sp.]